jgi:acyl-CoA reductase-like NAD-dependent aldehyde dehydrogenase
MGDDRYLDFVNPATGERFGQVKMTSEAEIQRAHAELKDAFPIWSAKPVAERIHIVRKFQQLLIDSVDEISEVLTRDTGKSRQDGMIEVFVTVDMMDQYRKHVRRWLKPRRVSQGLYLFKRCHVINRPYGVVAVLAPWNYPFALSIPPLVSALLAGNVVLLKPSEVTGASGVLIEELIQRVPELAPFVRVLHGDGAVGAALVKSAPDYIFLTGSTPTGRAVMRAAAENMIPTACELGGKDAMIVLEDADIPAAARWGVWGATYNTGQTCMSVERVYVVKEVYDEFVQRVLEHARQVRVGYTPDFDNPFAMGPVTDPRQLQTIQRHLEDARQQGARALVGGKTNGMFVEPTVLVDVTHAMLVMQEETFGPIIPIVRVADEAEAIRMSNDCDYGLGASIWSADIARARRVAEQIEASSVVINDNIAQFAVPMMPFGGIKHSGYGRIHGKEGLMQFTRPYAYAVGHPPVEWDIATVMRKPGHYQVGAALMKLAFGVSAEQRLEPIADEIRKLIQPSQAKQVAVGVGLFGAVAALTFGLFKLRGSRN